MKNLFFLLLLTITQSVFSQGEANNWRFGSGAGLDFNSGKPVALTNKTLMYTSESCASMSTEKGRLLFYSDGIRVWDSSNTLMPNGSGLKGNLSTTQGTLLIPKPGNKKVFFIFAIDDAGKGDGLTYSEIDMNLNSGKGDIVSGKKNITLEYTVCERIASVMHSNGEEIWVLIQKHKMDSIYAYLVTKSGINSKPVKSGTGIKLGNTHNTFGQMKISPNGRKIACAIDYWITPNKNMIADFDPSSGKISNIWSFPSIRSYGLEFSPKGEYLYISQIDSCRILQYKVKTGSEKEFIASQKTIDSGFTNFLGALQLGPDGKIYVAEYNNYYLHVINAPDSGGMQCRFQRDQVFLNTNSTQGLPSFISSYFNWINFEIKGTCLNDSISFTIPYFKNSDSLKWDFGDPESGINNTSTKSVNVYHIYKKTGTYKVSLINYYGNQKTLGYKFINIKSIKPSVGKDTFMCGSNSIQIGPKKDYSTYYWSNNSFNKTVIINKSGNYILKVLDNEGCSGIDTIYVKSVIDKPDLGANTVICNDIPIVLSIKKNYFSYKWSNNSTTKSIIIAKTGTYSLTTIDSFGCKGSDTIIVKKALTKAFFEANDICETDSVKFINKSIDGKIFKWKFGDGNSSPLEFPLHLYNIVGISTTFNVTLVVRVQGGCVDSLTKPLTVNSNPKSDFTYKASSNMWNFTPTQSGNTKYRWKFGDGDSTIAATASHSYKDGLSTHTVCLKATNAANCISETCKLIATTSIYHAQLPGFKIYPNPNTGNFTVEIDNPEKEILIEVYNLVGEKVKMVEMVGKVFDINLEVAPGIYLVKVRNGEMVYNQKVSIAK